MKQKIKYISMLLCITLTLGSCEPNVFDEAEVPTDPEQSETFPVIVPASIGPEHDTIFSLAFDPGDSLSPFEAESSNNRLICQLIYEGLFELDTGLRPQAVLCAEISTENYSLYDISVVEGRSFHNGQAITAADVVYSFQLARSSERWSSALGSVSSVQATGDYSLQITISEPNRNFAALLTFPVVCVASGDSSPPSGSGPYEYVSGSEYNYLRAYHGWPEYAALPFAQIYLYDMTGVSLNASFESALVDLVVNDPTGAVGYDYGGDYETALCDTTIMHYIGYSKTGILSDSDLRKAVSMLIDRVSIVSEQMGDMARASAIPINPVSPMFNEYLNSKCSYSVENASALLEQIGFADSNNDGILDRAVGSGRAALSIDFIVNTENNCKLEAARAIAEQLSRLGFNITLRELPWSEFISELQSNNYDMYYGEAMLTADFDISPLISSGGLLNYSRGTDWTYDTLLQAYNTASEQSAETALHGLLEHICSDAPIAAILFEVQQVFSHRAVITGLNPIQDNVFFGIETWTVDLS